MSMLSAQVDELRYLAYELENILPSYEVDLEECATALRSAADTIWELRGSVHRERAEADRLREELAIRKASEQEKVIEYLRQENIDWEDKYRTLAAENAKLRELVKQDHDYIIHLNEHEAHPSSADIDLHEWQMRELGIEVDE